MSSPQPQPHPAPAFTALLDAYTRWQHFERITVQGTLNLSDIPGYHEQAHLWVPTSAPLAFIMSCPYINVPDADEGERSCPICTDPYHHLSDRANDRKLKVAQRLPCGHHLCDHCVYEWLNPFAGGNNNTCPFDRRVFFPKLPHSLTTEGIQARLDLVDWFNAARGRQPMGAERDKIKGQKAILVERRLGEAIDELDVDRSKADTLMQSKISAREFDAAVLSACDRELQQLSHRLTTIRAIADSMVGHMQTSMFQAQLQHVTERLARI